MKKILLVNFIVIVVFLFFLEIFFLISSINYQVSLSKDKTTLKRHNQITVISYILNSYFKPAHSVYKYGRENLRPIAGKEFDKRPIILFGCSVTYGNLLNDDNNFSGILSRITKRPVYNMAFDGWCPAHMLRLLKDDKRLILVQNPEYVVYTYIKDQKRRLFFYQGWRHSSQLYKLYDLDKEGNLVEYINHYPFYWKFMTTKYIQYALERFNYMNEDKANNLMFKIFEESVSIIKSRYPDVKLVLLLYDVNFCSDSENVGVFDTEKVLSKYEQEKFKELGFEILNIEEVAGKSFCSEVYHAHCPTYGDVDIHHPSSKMWEEFVPKLVEKLNM